MVLWQAVSKQERLQRSHSERYDQNQVVPPSHGL